MKFTETKLKGAFVLDIEPREDDRGFFSRVFCKREFEEHGLNPKVVNTNMSHTKYKGTMRGFHMQKPPKGECKLVRCTAGALFDVIVDLREESPTYKQWFGVELSAKNRRMIYVPERFAHGFVTLEDATEVNYQISEFYSPEYGVGFRHNDPAFGIEWPLEPTIMTERDRQWPDFEEQIKLTGQL